MLRSRTLWLFFGILAVVIISSIVLMRMTSPPSLKPRLRVTEAPIDSYYTVRSTDGSVILQTGFPVNVGDIFINDNNRAFKIARVQKWEAVARPTELAFDTKTGDTPRVSLAQTILPKKGTPILPRGGAASTAGGIHVGMYHTHSDESYPISDGTTSIPGNGTIYEVGGSMANSLRTVGISVSHSDNAHGPHDSNAYYRSRRTVFQLLKERPDAVFDVHRDSAPAEAYYTLINGLSTSKSMIVVGRQNPNMSTNLAFARRIKEHADKVYPGLIRGIFIGRGNYNQDLNPGALLFEIGTDQLSRESAERGARNLGDVVAEVLRQRS